MSMKRVIIVFLAALTLAVPLAISFASDESKDSNVAQETAVKAEETIGEIAKSHKTPDSLEVLPIFGLGNPEAPVYLVEYASLSCGHCAEFHNDILPRIKEEYIDTEKVYIEFREFPTSKSGLHAAKLVRCMAEPRQYKFMDLLFQTQEQWAYTEDTTPLFQNAKLAGMNQDSIDACLADKDLEKDMMEAIQNAQGSYNVSSTPTVILFPTKEKMKGLHSYKTVRKQIERALSSAGASE